MDLQDIKGLKYYLACACIAIGAFAYSGVYGYKWFGSTPTEEERPSGTSRGPRIHRFHHK